MNLLLTQLPRRLEHGPSNFEAVAHMLDHYPAMVAADMLVLPELIG
jgi:hypothetical protein